MLRAIVGLIKGLVVGGGVAYGLLRLGLGGGLGTYLGCIVAGALAGVVCGRAPWRSDTIWTPVVKAIVGGIIGAGLGALGRNVLPEVHLATLQQISVGTHDATFLAAAVGVLYGIFVEVDDGGKSDRDLQAAPGDKDKPRAKK